MDPGLVLLITYCLFIFGSCTATLNASAMPEEVVDELAQKIIHFRLMAVADGLENKIKKRASSLDTTSLDAAVRQNDKRASSLDLDAIDAAFLPRGKRASEIYEDELDTADRPRGKRFSKLDMNALDAVIRSHGSRKIRPILRGKRALNLDMSALPRGKRTLKLDDSASDAVVRPRGKRTTTTSGLLEVDDTRPFVGGDTSSIHSNEKGDASNDATSKVHSLDLYAFVDNVAVPYDDSIQLDKDEYLLTEDSNEMMNGLVRVLPKLRKELPTDIGSPKCVYRAGKRAEKSPPIRGGKRAERGPPIVCLTRGGKRESPVYTLSRGGKRESIKPKPRGGKKDEPRGGKRDEQERSTTGSEFDVIDSPRLLVGDLALNQPGKRDFGDSSPRPRAGKRATNW